MRDGFLFGIVMLACGMLPAGGTAESTATNGSLNSIADIEQALHGCWKWPPLSEAHSRMELTMQLRFKRNGEIIDAHLTYEKRDVSDEERALYHGALLETLKLCVPLPLSASLGEAIAGRALILHIHDTRQNLPL